MKTISIGKKIVILAILLVTGSILIKTAWQSDDAFIAFRTAQNFWNNQGLCWNPGERVQPFTSTLWMFVSLVCYGLFNEVYFSIISLSILISLYTIYLIIFRLNTNLVSSIILFLIITSSAAAMDFATSGLENPLLSFLLIILLIQAVKLKNYNNHKMILIYFLMALICLTRQDTLLIILPLLICYFWKNLKNTKNYLYLLIGFSPIILWESFSLIYYGSLVPNTAYAKLNLGIPKSALYTQGLEYFKITLTRDPITLIAIATGVCLGFWRSKSEIRLLSFGIILYLLYIIHIGGDFMSGRFFVSAFYIAVTIISININKLTCLNKKIVHYLSPIMIAVLTCYAIFIPNSRWLTGSDFGKSIENKALVISGICDERAYYYPTTGLLNVIKHWHDIKKDGLPIPPNKGAIEGDIFSKNKEERVTTYAAVGYFGYFAGSQKYIIDIRSLCDPFLSRLAFKPQNGKWRIGHYIRVPPNGYLITRALNDDRYLDDRYLKLYRSVQNVVSGPLFTKSRWKDIWELNFNSKLLLDVNAKISTDHLSDLINEGNKCLKRNDIDGAENIFIRALKIDDSSPNVLKNLAYINYIKKKYFEAILFYKLVLIHRPEPNKIFYNIACIYSLNNQLELSSKYLDAAISTGFNDLNKVNMDVDLKNLRKSKNFKSSNFASHF